jgi:hypothetical protein
VSDDNKKAPRSFIRVSTKYKRLYVNPATHDILGNPPFYEFLLSDEKKQLFIAPVWENKIGSYSIPVYNGQRQRREIVVRGIILFAALTKKFGWQANMNYKYFGEYIPEYNIIGFQMSNPVIMERAIR